MPTYAQIMLLRGQGKSFAAIGEKLGISRKYAHVIFTGYKASPVYQANKKARKKHDYHSDYKDDCRYCQNELTYGN